MENGGHHSLWWKTPQIGTVVLSSYNPITAFLKEIAGSYVCKKLNLSNISAKQCKFVSYIINIIYHNGLKGWRT